MAEREPLGAEPTGAPGGKRTGGTASFLAELRRRHVMRAAIVYAAAVWALAQGISQLGPAFDLPALTTRWFVIACAIGFPFWIAFAWYFKFTSHGIERESEAAEDTAAARRTGRRLDYWIIGILAIAVVLLLTNQLVLQRGSTIHEFTGTAVTSSAAAIPAKSVAVLPFVNESGEKGEQYFSDGLSEDLITALSQFAGLKVISRDSSFQFRNSTDSSAVIGRKLGVAHLLEGSVQRAGDEVRISAELVNAANGATLWSQRYDRPYKDLFALQDAITKAVAAALKAKLLTAPGAVVQTNRPPSGNLIAYNAFLQGQFYFRRATEPGLREAITQFTKATRLDPHYAAAYAAASESWTRLAGYFSPAADKPDAYAKARAAAVTALRLDPDSAAAHGAEASVLVNADFDWMGAQAEYRRTLQLAPNNAIAKFGLSTIQATLGHPQSAVGLVRDALKSNPLQAFWNAWLASYLGAVGRLDEARVAALRAVALQPQAPLSYRELAYIEAMRGNAAAALAAAKSVPPGRNRNIALAWALQIGPDRAAADAALKTLMTGNSGDSSYQIAEVYALRHDPDKMFEWLDRAWANRDDGIQYLLYDPIILHYKNDPRFAVFCRKVGLPATTTAVAMN